MPARPDWQTGTVQLAAGATALVGTNTAWLSANLQAGDTLQLRNLTAIIASVNSDTSITLAEAWTGGAVAAGSAYRIRYQADGSRLAAATRDLIATLGSGNVDAIAQLASAADRLPYFTGAGQAALATLTAFARTILDDADGAAACATIGAVKTTGGDTISGPLGLAPGLSSGAGVWALDATANGTVTFAQGASFYLAAAFSGLVVLNNTSSGSVGLFAVGGGAAALIGQVGTQFAVGVTSGKIYSRYSSGQYYFTNDTGAPANVYLFSIRMRPSA